MNAVYLVEWKMTRGDSWRWWSVEKSKSNARYEVAFIKDTYVPYGWRITKFSRVAPKGK